MRGLQAEVAEREEIRKTEAKKEEFKVITDELIRQAKELADRIVKDAEQERERILSGIEEERDRIMGGSGLSLRGERLSSRSERKPGLKMSC